MFKVSDIKSIVCGVKNSFIQFVILLEYLTITAIAIIAIKLVALPSQFDFSKILPAPNPQAYISQLDSIKAQVLLNNWSINSWYVPLEDPNSLGVTMQIGIRYLAPSFDSSQLIYYGEPNLLFQDFKLVGPDWVERYCGNFEPIRKKLEKSTPVKIFTENARVDSVLYEGLYAKYRSGTALKIEDQQWLAIDTRDLSIVGYQFNTQSLISKIDSIHPEFKDYGPVVDFRKHYPINKVLFGTNRIYVWADRKGDTSKGFILYNYHDQKIMKYRGEYQIK
ncbi:MAG: hypothetical protein K9M19_05035 [Candidatus Marinimicrobia bacterium]|nr:hypothetical protein [Candidatus Neomarinimicrobiota bacterium]